VAERLHVPVDGASWHLELLGDLVNPNIITLDDREQNGETALERHHSSAVPNHGPSLSGTQLTRQTQRDYHTTGPTAWES
jgi:hypothetical protein